MSEQSSTNAGSFDHMVRLHHEAGTWWAECDDIPGWSAAADTRDELLDHVRQSIEELSPGSRWYLWHPAEANPQKDADHDFPPADFGQPGPDRVG